MFLDNKYTKWYLQLVETRKELIRDCYTENHHILPASLGGADDGTNMVRLTAREHFVAHLLLSRMLAGGAKRKMVFALNMMRGKGTRVEIYIPSARIYEICRKAFSEAQKSREVSKETRAKTAASSRGKILSDVTKDKIRRKALGRLATQDARENMARAQLGRKHEPRSEEWKAKQRASHLGRTDSTNAFQNKSKAQAGANNPRAKTWLLEREDGTTFEVHGLKPWCRSHGISFAAICRRDGRWFNGIRLSNEAD